MSQKYKFNTKEIGKRLKEARDSLGMTIDKMHDITGFSRSLISEAENGLKKPSPIYLFALLDKFNVNINYIFTGRGKMFLLREDEECYKGEDGEKIKELLFHMKNVDMLRYSILSYYSKYIFENKDLIEKILSNRNEKIDDND